MSQSISSSKKLKDIIDKGILGSRNLATSEDLKEVNELLKQTKLVLPPMTVPVEKKMRFITLKLDIDVYDLECTNINIESVNLNSVWTDEKNLELKIEATKISVDCSSRWHYEKNFFSGTGGLSANIMINSLSTSFLLNSKDFDTMLPHVSVTRYCKAAAAVSNLNIEGTGLGGIAGMFKNQIEPLIAEELRDIVCDKIDILDDQILSGLNKMSIMFNKYSSEGNEKETSKSPSFVLESTDISENLKLFNLESNMTKMAIEMINNKLSGDDGNDPGINSIMANFFKDQGSVIKIDGSEIFPDQVLYQNQDDLLKTKLTLQEIRVKGLDRLSRFEPFNVINSHSISTSVGLDKIQLEIDIDVEISPAQTSGAANSIKIQESMTAMMEYKNIDILLEFVLAIDMNSIGNKQLGSFVHIDRILPCVMNSCHALGVSKVAVDIDEITIPNTSNFISGGLTEVINNFIEVIFNLGGSVFNTAIPNIASTEIPKWINNMVDEKLDKSCESPSQEKYSDVVDFRHLFGIVDEKNALNEPDQSFEHYGQLIKLAKEKLDKVLKAVDPLTDLPSINDSIIGPFTRIQSNNTGMLKFKGNLYSIDTAIEDLGLYRVQLKLIETRIENLDSFGGQSEILNPQMSNPFSLHNKFGIGMYGKPITLYMRVLVSIDTIDTIDTPEMGLWNDIEFSFDIKAAEVLANFLILISENRLFSFPLRDLPNIHCWLSTISDFSHLTRYTIEEKLSFFRVLLEKLNLSVESIDIALSCIKCTKFYGPHFQDISDFLSSSKTKEIISSSLEHFSDFVSTYVHSDKFNSNLSKIIDHARHSCPHDPLYDTSAANTWDLKTFVKNMPTHKYIRRLKITKSLEDSIANDISEATISSEPLKSMHFFHSLLLGFILASFLAMFVNLSRLRHQHDHLVSDIEFERLSV